MPGGLMVKAETLEKSVNGELLSLSIGLKVETSTVK
jgi:hypothetical protein